MITVRPQSLFMPIITISIGAMSIAFSSLATAEKIYSYKNLDGEMVISTTPPPKGVQVYTSDQNVGSKSEMVASNSIIVKDGIIMTGKPINQPASNSIIVKDGIIMTGPPIESQFKADVSSQPKALYQFVAANGIVHYTDKPSPNAVKIADFVPEKTLAASDFGAGNWYNTMEQYPSSYNYTGKPSKGLGPKATHYNPIVQKYAAMYNVDPYLVHAVIRAESAYNPRAVSSAGAAGLMQLMPATAKRFGVTNRLDPNQNIRGGVQYLSVLIKLFKGNITLVLAGYNAGENAVISRDYKVPNFPETKGYVVKVMEYYYNYRSGI